MSRATVAASFLLQSLRRQSQNRRLLLLRIGLTPFAPSGSQTHPTSRRTLRLQLGRRVIPRILSSGVRHGICQPIGLSQPSWKLRRLSTLDPDITEFSTPKAG